MRNMIILLGIIFVTMSGYVRAEAEFDFEELMEAVEDNAHELQAFIVNEDADNSLKLTQELKEAFKRVEGYFDAWGDAQDAVDDSKQYQKKLDEITAFLQQKDFGSASSAAVDFANNCDKACHDKYKPL